MISHRVLKNEESCELSRFFSGTTCLFIINSCTCVFIFTNKHRNWAICRTVGVTPAEANLINAAQMAAPFGIFFHLALVTCGKAFLSGSFCWAFSGLAFLWLCLLVAVSFNRLWMCKMLRHKKQCNKSTSLAFCIQHMQPSVS